MAYTMKMLEFLQNVSSFLLNYKRKLDEIGINYTFDGMFSTVPSHRGRFPSIVGSNDNGLGS
jgi:hypothetical protein